MAKKLARYAKRRNFKKTPEPKALGSKKSKKKPKFVIQKHHASHLHYDFRIEVDGVLKSWAVPKCPSRQSKEKRLAIQTEDHPLSYANFEGTIPKGQYGAGKVKIWDRGTYENMKRASIKTCMKKGVIEIHLKGKKLHGVYALVHYRGKQWLLIKTKEKQLRDAA